MAPRPIRCLVSMIPLLALAGCFAPTFEARLAGPDGGVHPGDTGTCVPSCAGRQCGADGCAGSCGGCPSGQYCGSSGQCGGCSDVTLRCGSLCCGKDQKCANGACFTCGCGTRVCGSDDCGLPCGTCMTGFTCDWTGKCVGGTNKCQGVTCNVGEACDAADGLCKCAGTAGTQGSCPATWVCSATKRCAQVTDPCATKVCTGTTPVCINGACVCNAVSCNAGNVCGTDGTCQPGGCSTTVCGGVCCVPGQICNAGICTSPGCMPPCAGSTPDCDPASLTCRCTSSSCPAGQVCLNARCVSGPCAPSCVSGETCVGTTCACVPPSPGVSDSCVMATSGDFYCDATTKRCRSAKTTCSGATCAAGQICAVPQGGTGTTSVCTCSYADAATGTKDSCEKIGKICDPNSASATTGAMTCTAPGDLEPCMKGVGCATTGHSPALSCETLSTSAGTGDLCVMKCGSSSVCGSQDSSCQQVGGVNICYRNKCADPSCPNPSSTCTAASERAKYYQPCNAAATGDGICVPLPGIDVNGNAIDVGVCYQTGTSSSTCDFYGSRTAPAKMCAQGLLCELVQANAGNTNYQGICRAPCNPVKNGVPVKTCAAGTSCNELVGYYQVWWATGQSPADMTPYQATYGTCDPTCSLLAANTCGPDALGNPQGCSLLSRDTAVCAAIAPSAVGVGTTCDTINDIRKVCTGNLYCDTGYAGATNLCLPYCSTTSCPPSPSTFGGANCPGCATVPSYNTCYPQCFGTGFNMGQSSYCAACCSGGCNGAGTTCGTGTMPVTGYCD